MHFPIVPPMTMPVMMLAQSDPTTPTVPDPTTPTVPDPTTIPMPSADAQKEAKRALYTWGVLGVATGALISAGVSAAAFGAYRRSGSLWAPALVSGVSSLAVGGALLWFYGRSLADPAGADKRHVAAAVGVQLTA